MVDRPRITPQAARGSARAVPTIAQGQVATDFRRVPTVRPTGFEAQAAALNVEAQSLAVATEVLRANTADIITGLEETQRLEAERIYAENALDLERRLRDAKQNVNPETDNFTEMALSEY